MNWLGTALGLGSAVSWACANVSIKPSSQRFGSWSALVWTQLIGGLLVTLAALAFEGPPTDVMASATPLLIAGVSAGVAYGGLFAALGSGQLAVIAPIISVWSVVSVGIAVVRDGAPISVAGASGVVLVLLGNVVLARSGAERDGATPPSAVMLALVSSLGFGIMVPAIDHVRAGIGPLWTVPLVWAIELTILVPILWRLGKLERRPRSRYDLFVASRAAVFEVAGFICLSYGLAYAPVTVISPLSSLQTAGSVALGLLLLGERVRRSALLGAVAASIGVVLVNW
jgi:drug/metabolite transporter (DMT)-like permease